LIKDLFAFFGSGDNTIVAEDLEMLAKIGLGQIEHVLDIGNRKGLVAKKMDDLQTLGMSQTFMKVRMKV